MDEKNFLLERAVEYFEKRIYTCDMCARRCQVNRHEKTGVCGQGALARVSASVLHFGEEPPLVGEGGAGAVFFSGCGMRCVYCQNFAFSQLNHGKLMDANSLASIFLSIQNAGAKTLDLITPEPHLHVICKALLIAKESGFSLPIIFNTSSYVGTETLRFLDGIIDIYLADIRYTDNEIGKNFSAVPDYWSVAQQALREMYRQVGPFNEERMKGLIIRHLVLPTGISGTDEMARFVAEELSASVPISLMSQYFPVYRAKEISPLNRRITEKEYEKALDAIEKYGLEGWCQPLNERLEGVRAKALHWKGKEQ